MVGRIGNRSYRCAALLLLFSLVLVLVACGLAAAQTERAEDTQAPTIKEDMRVTVDKVGDARVEDKVSYSADDFEVVKSVNEQYPTFLTRRFNTGKNLIEVENFKSNLNDTEDAIELSFDSPGYAYNMGDNWVVYVSGKPKTNSGGTVTFKDVSTMTSEFTLGSSQPVEVTTTLVLPKGATDVNFDSKKGAIKYKLPSAVTADFWSDNRTLLASIFGGCTLLFAVLLPIVLFVKTKEKEPKPAAAVSQPAVPPAPPRHQKRFCTKCGGENPPGVPFCGKCGSPM